MIEGLVVGSEMLKPIPGYAKYYATQDGRIFKDIGDGIFDARELCVTMNRGYMSVRIPTKPNLRKYMSVHRLIAITFIAPIIGKNIVRHLDGNPSNNDVSNLAWGTAKENSADREAHGRTARGDRSGARMHPEKLSKGESHYAAKMTAADVMYIRENPNIPSRVIAEKLGVSGGAVRMARRGATWSHAVPK